MSEYKLSISASLGLIAVMLNTSVLTDNYLIEDDFIKAIKRLRSKAAANPPSLDEIKKEVEAVKAKRYAKNKG